MGILRLSHVEVRIGQQDFALRDVEVRSVERERVGVRFAPPAGDDGDRLRTILVELAGAARLERLEAGRRGSDLLLVGYRQGCLERLLETVSASRAEG